MAVALRDRQLEMPIANGRQTLGQFLLRWLQDSVKPTVRPRTYSSYSQLLLDHVIPALGQVPLGKLGPQHVQGFLNQKLRQGRLSGRTIQYLHAVLRAALNQALRWRLVQVNVATLVDPPRAERHEVHPLTPREARTLLDAAQGDRLAALYALALAVGLRQGEALGLHWEDVDLEAGNLRVRVALQRQDGRGLQSVEPKTARSRRGIVLPPYVVESLRAHRSRQVQERLLAGSRWQETGLVFTTAIGTPLDGGSVTHRFQRMLERAGLPRLRFHDLRHACASLLLAQGVHPRVVMEILGHSQISLTMNTYSHVIPALQREAADRMDAVLAK
jgi:integrase